MKKTSLYFSILFLSFIFSSPNNLAKAEDNPSGFLISPFFQEINLQKDQPSAPFFINLKNNTGNPAVFRVLVLDFGTLDESGGVAFLGSADNLKYSLASWVSLPNDTLVLAPGEEQTVKGFVENRESLSPGGHYGAIFFKTEDDSIIDNNKDSVFFNPSFASLLFVRKIGGEIYGLNFSNSEFSKNIFVVPNQIRIRFQNTGNVHVVPRGTVEVVDPMGSNVLNSIINSESGIILPESFRVFPSKFMPIARAFIPGRYQMTINYRYDGKDDFTSRRASFFLIPPTFSLAIIFLIAISIGYFIISHKNKKNKNVSFQKDK